MEDIKVLNTKTKPANISSILFLLIVVLSTAILYFFNNQLVTNIEDLQTNIGVIESNVKEVEKDKNIQIYSLLELNKNVINSYESMNKIASFINNLNLVKSKYNLELSGFDLSQGEITTNVKVISDEQGIAFQKARDFINKYRLDTNSLFELGFVSAFEGMDEIKFKVNLKIK